MVERVREKVVVLGSGFAGVRFARELDYRRYQATMVSPRNHFLFTPLLPSTTVGTLEFRSVIEPVRAVCPKARFYLAQARSVDPARKVIACEGALDGRVFELEYDSLVIAVGVANQTFGIPGVRENALFLKEAGDARAIRQRVLECFETASQPGLAEEERAALLHFVVVGGGPTGVEFAAELHDLLVEDMEEPYGRVVSLVRITLLEAMPQILGSFDQALSEYTLRHFQRQKIEVRTGSPVVRVEAGLITLKDGTAIRNGLVVWAAGVTQGDFVKALPFPKDKAGRLRVDESLRVQGAEGIYAMGDCAVVEGKGYPATAQVAEQQGRYLARAFRRRAGGREDGNFRYKHQGMLAYVGGNRALADLSKIKGRGFSTFLFWRSAYLTKLVSMRNRILVLFDWVKTEIFGRDISRF
jgi:NADH:ubiquinone reductase (non-electrogenic)